jgi:hypothetical protein
MPLAASPFRIREFAIATGAAALVFIVVTIAWHRRDPPVHIDFDADRLLTQPVLRGFHDPQRNDEGEWWAWTTGAAQIRLRDLDRTVAWTARIRASDGARPPALEPSTLVVSADGVIVGTFRLSGEFADLDVRIPSQPTGRRGRRGDGLVADMRSGPR